MKKLISTLGFLFILPFFTNPISNSEAFKKPITQTIFFNGSSWEYKIFPSTHKNIPMIQTLTPYFRINGKTLPTKYPLFYGVDKDHDLNVDQMYEDTNMDGWTGGEKIYFGKSQFI